MYFVTLELTDDGKVSAVAKGHGTDVLDSFHEVAKMLLSSRGPWRITYVQGTAPPEEQLDSEMKWTLIAKSKDRGV